MFNTLFKSIRFDSLKSVGRKFAHTHTLAKAREDSVEFCLLLPFDVVEIATLGSVAFVQDLCRNTLRFSYELTKRANQLADYFLNKLEKNRNNTAKWVAWFLAAGLASFVALIPMLGVSLILGFVALVGDCLTEIAAGVLTLASHGLKALITPIKSAKAIWNFFEALPDNYKNFKRETKEKLAKIFGDNVIGLVLVGAAGTAVTAITALALTAIALAVTVVGIALAIAIPVVAIGLVIYGAIKAGQAFCACMKSLCSCCSPSSQRQRSIREPVSRPGLSSTASARTAVSAASGTRTAQPSDYSGPFHLDGNPPPAPPAIRLPPPAVSPKFLSKPAGIPVKAATPVGSSTSLPTPTAASV